MSAAAVVGPAHELHSKAAKRSPCSLSTQKQLAATAAMIHGSIFVVLVVGCCRFVFLFKVAAAAGAACERLRSRDSLPTSGSRAARRHERRQQQHAGHRSTSASSAN
jgi:hypothetical protein